LLLTITVVLPVRAQGNVTLKIDELESVSGQKMRALVTVRDENGVPVPDLAAGNFVIVEDQRTYFPPEEVSSQINPTAGLSVLLLLDLSSNMQGQPLVEAKAASQKLLETLLNQANDPDRAAFLGLTDVADINSLAFNPNKPEVGFTNDRNLILNRLNAIEGVEGKAGGTPLYDALFRAIKLTANQPGPRAIVVITDGLDPKKSKLTQDDPISEANRNNIPVFPIGFSRGAIDNEYLTRVAARTGGAYYRAPDAANFSTIFQDILNRLSHQYVLSYQSQLKLDTQPHAVIIRVEHPKGKTSGDKVFNFKDVPTAAPTAAPVAKQAAQEPPAVAAATIAPAPTMPTVVPTVTPPQGVLDKVKDFVTERRNLPLLIGLVAILLALLALLLFFILRRGRQAAEQPYYAEPAFGSFEPPTAGTPSVGHATAVGDTGGIITGGGIASGSLPPTAVGQGAPPGAATPFGGTPFGAPPAFGPTAQPPMSGGTVILQRGPQAQVLGLLVNRKRPQERFDVTMSVDIGRATSNNIVLNHPTVSRQHAKIKFEKGEFWVFDLGSANRTYVNDKPVTDPATLKEGDAVKFGELEFTFKRLA
jgi:VWFA-related protein